MQYTTVLKCAICNEEIFAGDIVTVKKYRCNLRLAHRDTCDSNLEEKCSGCGNVTSKRLCEEETPVFCGSCEAKRNKHKDGKP